MMSPRDVRKYIESQNVNFGQNVTLPDVVDVCECEEFFGTRCDENVHVTGPNQAHVDRKDPRQNPLGHLKHDTGIPYSFIGAAGGSALGGIIYKKDRKKGALYGGAILGGIGLIADIVSAYREQKTSQYYL